MRLLASSREAALSAIKPNAAIARRDDQALDGFIVDHQEAASGVELRVHVISEVAR